jgi:hypothetical protein
MDHQLPSNIEQPISALQSIEEIAGLAREEIRWMDRGDRNRAICAGWELIFA